MYCKTLNTNQLAGFYTEKHLIKMQAKKNFISIGGRACNNRRNATFSKQEPKSLPLKKLNKTCPRTKIANFYC